MTDPLTITFECQGPCKSLHWMPCHHSRSKVYTIGMIVKRFAILYLCLLLFLCFISYVHNKPKKEKKYLSLEKSSQVKSVKKKTD